MYTHFGCRRIEDELGLAIFLRYRIVAGNDDRAIWIPIRGQAEPKDRKV